MTGLRIARKALKTARRGLNNSHCLIHLSKDTDPASEAV